MADFAAPTINEKFGIISTSKSGWTTELNLVTWGTYAPKYDIRPWDPSHEKMGKGITLTKEELVTLKNILNSMNLEQ